jgi:DNA repair protein RecO
VKSKELGILIDKHHYSETSSILNFYTFEKGYASFIFKGVKKKGKSLNQLGLYELSYFRRPESDLGIIQSMDYAWTPTRIYTEPQKVMLVFFMADILKQTIKHQGPDPHIFEFIQAQLIDLETRTSDFLFPTQFLSQFMGLLGYAPLFDEENAHAFDIERGVFTHTPSGSKYVQDPAILAFLKAQFILEETEEYPKEVIRKGLEVLVQYAELHLPNFSLKVTMEVIRDTLYA